MTSGLSSIALIISFSVIHRRPDARPDHLQLALDGLRPTVGGGGVDDYLVSRGVRVETLSDERAGRKDFTSRDGWEVLRRCGPDSGLGGEPDEQRGDLRSAPRPRLSQDCLLRRGQVAEPRRDRAGEEGRGP